MIRTQIQLTDRQASALRERAARERVSMAELIRRSVDTLLASDGSPDRAEIRRRALSAIGCVHSGVNDLATKHDEYLAEAYAE